jgi:homoserine O-succinyltransferase
VPCSRYTYTRIEDIEKRPQLRVLATSEEAGLCLVDDLALHQVYMFNHLEYDTTTLADEYARDLQARPDDVRVPQHYFPGDDPERAPQNTWRSHGHLIFANWINMVYQTTPFDVAEIGADRAAADAAAE